MLRAVPTISVPLNQLAGIDGMASVAMAVWWCRICGKRSQAGTAAEAASAAIEHLSVSHGGVLHGPPDDHTGRGIPAR